MATATQPRPVPAHKLSFEPKQLPKLRSNTGEYVDSASVGWMLPTPVETPMQEMRRRFEEDGYIFVKGVTPREDVLDMREQYTFLSSFQPFPLTPLCINERRN